ncbi:MAG TPA: D-aminoacyl-tRNA deacylase [Fimbriimonadaceae bacterium]|nr:D-aminoacyl-tRNA deacylase [Fimbriimonadaceae bacterium]HRJ33371.1 D-aminoacyl-tRNA deacylase [Fimbriimonadaceae bacterium]
MQRVLSAEVEVEARSVGKIGPGLLVLVAAHRRDTLADAAKMADRIAKIRIFSDADGKMNLSLLDLPTDRPGGVLLVSNFTVYGETAKNRRPSFIDSAPYQEGEVLFQELVEQVKKLGIQVETGVFGGDMKVSLVNDGPVTVILEVGPSGRD